MITEFSKDVQIIQKLSDMPNQEEGLSADELKKKFDQAPEDIKEYLNTEVVPAVQALQKALNNGEGFALDDTLSIAGRAADAAATGEAISAVCLTATDDGTGIITLSYGGEVTPGGGFAVSPTIVVTEIDGGHTVTLTDVNGSQSFDVMDGKDGIDGDPGTDGADGYTPVKGTDYYTEADKQEMVSLVLAAMPTWEGGSY